MLELLGLGLFIAVALAVCAILWALVSLICWVLFLPFKLLGLVFKGLALLLALPFLILAGLLGVAVFGAGMVLFFIPALPLVLLVLAIWLIARRRSGPAASVSA